MELSEETSGARYQIKKYAPGCITVNEQDYNSAILVMPNFIGELNSKNFIKAYQYKPEVLLLGTGDTAYMPKELLKDRQGIEVMTTNAACRTYTILIAEGRNVLAALMV